MLTVHVCDGCGRKADAWVTLAHLPNCAVFSAGQTISYIDYENGERRVHVAAMAPTSARATSRATLSPELAANLRPQSQGESRFTGNGGAL